MTDPVRFLLHQMRDDLLCHLSLLGPGRLATRVRCRKNTAEHAWCPRGFDPGSGRELCVVVSLLQRMRMSPARSSVVGQHGYRGEKRRHGPHTHGVTSAVLHCKQNSTPMPTNSLRGPRRQLHGVPAGRDVDGAPQASILMMSSAEEMVKAPPSSRLMLVTTPFSTSMA